MKDSESLPEPPRKKHTLRNVIIALIMIFLGVPSVAGIIVSEYMLLTSPQVGLFVIIMGLVVGIPMISVLLLRAYIEKPYTEHLVRGLTLRVFAVFWIWFIFIFMLGTVASFAIIPNTQGTPLESDAVIAVTVALSFWIIENASKATVHLVKSVIPTKDQSTMFPINSEQ